MRRFAIALLIPLVACSTPREQCEYNATKDLNVVSQLIVETRQNIERGYALEVEVRSRPYFTWCVGDTLDSNGNVMMSWCNRTETYETEKPVAVDIEAEKAKLQSLLKKRQSLKVSTRDALAQCAVTYPEG